ncbi:uncharacterized protein IL334_002890 [Kwoniella shivajii]|uniref:Alpha-ketoglutarate-dependent dioxygenase AlkB-like domain-containing protein n=1 Tax=Kwoniella shivajii TaxID=564305 RepID=A0ABZ1CX96_9TREE|nr:hypothetical protein IL334_002890 [Kwoniella shivajii]
MIGPRMLSKSIHRFVRYVHTIPPPPAVPPPLTLQSVSPLIRPHKPCSSTNYSIIKSDDFSFWPGFFTPQECKTLLEMALWKLDRVDTTLKRRRGDKSVKDIPTVLTSQDDVQGLQLLFDKKYGFEEGHYDSVIHQYRETLLSSLPPSSPPSLNSILSRLYALLPNLPVNDTDPDSGVLPPKGSLTHLLHLAPEGEILAHVDNLEASGSVICGVSLGASRTLRLEKKEKDGEDKGSQGWDVRLDNGSVYLQRDTVRYHYEHSILPYSSEGSVWDGKKLQSGHRISIMIRDAPSRPAHL